jgi:hypothetical protein
MLPSSQLVPLGQKMKIRYNGEVAYWFEDIHEASTRSTYFDALLNRWEHNIEDSTHDIPSTEGVEISVVTTVLQAIDTNELNNEMLLEQSLQEIIAISLYFGCPPSLLRCIYHAAAALKPMEKLQFAHFLEKQNDHGGLRTLLNIQSFFDGFDKATIPMFPGFVTDIKSAMALLSGYKNAPEQSFIALALWTYRSLLHRSMSAPMRVDHFGLRIIKKLHDVYWSPIDLDMLFSVLPVTSSGYIKPEGLEGFIVKSISQQKDIPVAIRHWDVDVTLIAPALFEAGKLSDAPTYEDPQELIRTIVDSWLPEECVSALEEDKGGLRTIFETLPPQGCRWLAEIRIFRDCRRVSQGMVQRLLYRSLFLHTDLDLDLPPRLLTSLLPLFNDLSVRKRALEYAVRYLQRGEEHAISLLNLPWGEANVGQTKRAAAAIQNDNSKIWLELDVSKLRNSQYILKVPTKVLSGLAYEKSFRAHNKIARTNSIISDLERELSGLKDDHKRMEKKLRGQSD